MGREAFRTDRQREKKEISVIGMSTCRFRVGPYWQENSRGNPRGAPLTCVSILLCKRPGLFLGIGFQGKRVVPLPLPIAKKRGFREKLSGVPDSESRSARFVADHPVLTYHPFFLQPEHFVELPRCGLSAVIIGFGRSRLRVTPVVLGSPSDFTGVWIGYCEEMGTSQTPASVRSAFNELLSRPTLSRGGQRERRRGCDRPT
jgi:hypothetical protein